MGSDKRIYKVFPEMTKRRCTQCKWSCGCGGSQKRVTRACNSPGCANGWIGSRSVVPQHKAVTAPSYNAAGQQVVDVSIGGKTVKQVISKPSRVG